MRLYHLNKMQKDHEFLHPEDYPDPASDHDGSRLQQLLDTAENGLVDESVENYLSNDLFFLGINWQKTSI